MTPIKTHLARARALACDLLAAVPREEAASSLQREREARGWERDELRRQLEQCQGDLLVMRTAAQGATNNERRLVDQLQRLETALSAEQGLRARAESAAIEVVGLRAEVDKRQQCEAELRDLQERALRELRARADADYRRLSMPARALIGALEGWSLSDGAQLALGNLRVALGMVR